MANKISNDLTVRTTGEELWLARKAAGLTSYEAAARAGVGRNAYRDAELDRNPGAGGLKTGLRKVGKPGLPALLALARRRAGYGLAEAAEWAQCSRVTFLRRERDGDPILKGYWAYLGFRFPVK